MKVFNKIAIFALASTMMVAHVQAIELVKVEPMAKFSITKADQEILAESMKINISTTTSAKAMLDAQKAPANYLGKSKTQNIAKVVLIAE